MSGTHSLHGVAGIEDDGRKEEDEEELGIESRDRLDVASHAALVAQPDEKADHDPNYQEHRCLREPVQPRVTQLVGADGTENEAHQEQGQHEVDSHLLGGFLHRLFLGGCHGVRVGTAAGCADGRRQKLGMCRDWKCESPPCRERGTLTSTFSLFATFGG